MAAEAQTLSYNAFIDSLKSHNASYRAQVLNIDISQAEIKAARATQDPTISIEYGNNSDWLIAMGQSASAEISKAFAPAKAASRIAVAQQQLTLSQDELDDYWRQLKADATIAYYQALLAKQVLTIDSQAYTNMAALATSDSIRFEKGEISEVDMMQSRIEQQAALLHLNSRRTDFRNSLVALEELCGCRVGYYRDVEGRLVLPVRLFDLQQLIDNAMANRADLKAASSNVDLVERQETQAIRERHPDLELSLGASRNTRVHNEEAPAPEYMGYTLGLTLPLPVSSVNSGVRQAARLRREQAELQKQSLSTTIQSEVVRSYNDYQSSLERAQAYGKVLISEAQQVLNGKLYAYQRGDTSLLDVLVAQHTYNEMQEEYAQSLYDCMAALVELERAAGL